MDQRKVFMTTVSYRVENVGDQHARLDDINYENNPDRSVPHQGCTHCGSKKNDDRGCWKRLTCQKCGRKEHPSDKCFYAVQLARMFTKVENALWYSL